MSWQVLIYILNIKDILNNIKFILSKDQSVVEIKYRNTLIKDVKPYSLIDIYSISIPLVNSLGTIRPYDLLESVQPLIRKAVLFI